MTKVDYIRDSPAPLNQNFTELKNAALAYIEAVAGNVWSNLNASDPGVTILDQVCYALTELGYCNDFSVKDILTKPNGKLETDNQFYLPEEILTTSPLTAMDYIKYLVSNVQGINNVIVRGNVFVDCLIVRRQYQVFLYLQPDYNNDAVNVCNAAFYSLNKVRNLGEEFLPPVALTPKVYAIAGSLNIDNENNLQRILSDVQQAIENFIFPTLLFSGYKALREEGCDTDEIFNGPDLRNGWATTQTPDSKRDKITMAQLTGVIESVKGVVSFQLDATSGNAALGKDPKNNSGDENLFKSGEEELIVIDLLASLNNSGSNLQVLCNKVLLNTQNVVSLSSNQSSPLSNRIVYGAFDGSHTEIPKGKYREIDTYYSIQNTFPEAYNVGIFSVDGNADSFKIAQSRQLRGYLTLFDQVMANQFSQLANVNRLFSFKNAQTGTPTELKAYEATIDRLNKRQSEYPAPFLSFASTYFYRSLYNVPHIKLLLKNNNAFGFSYVPESNKTLEENDWRKYKQDPYNSYIYGLFRLMEQEDENFERRNDLLNHLLARHGESPQVIDLLISNPSYTADSVADKVVLKSLYLQNLKWLSYNRQKSYNYLAANKIPETLPLLSVKYFEDLMKGYEKNFVLRSEWINDLEKLDPADFINFSAVELKLRLMLSMRLHYSNYLAGLYIAFQNQDATSCNYQLARMARWMIEERCGCIMIEPSMLWDYSGPVAATEPDKNNPAQPDMDSVEQSLHATVTPNSLGITFPDLVFIIPDFIPQLNTPQFKNNLDLFLSDALPVHLNAVVIPLSEDDLNIVIPLYAAWHNSKIYVQMSRIITTTNDAKNESGMQLCNILNKYIDKR